jgi:integrase
MTTRINFTKATLMTTAIAQGSNKKSITLHDSVLRGLICTITANGNRTFFLYQKVQGKPIRTRLGRFPELSVEQARTEALKIKAGYATEGLHHRMAQPRKKAITLLALFTVFFERHSKPHKVSWRYDTANWRLYLQPWAKREATEITRANWSELHATIAQKHGITAANRTISMVRCMYNRGIDWGLVEKNPITGLKLFKERSRERFIQPAELPNFFAALKGLRNPIMQAYFELALLTGARKTNLLLMKKEDVNLDLQIWRIPYTKNGHSQIIPLVPRAVELLQPLMTQNPASPWVFSTHETKSGHIEHVNKTWHRLIEKAGLKDLRLHDLRRSLASYQVLSGANSFIIGQTLGHRSLQSTAVYARMNLDAVRSAMGNAVDLMKRTGLESKPDQFASDKP